MSIVTKYLTFDFKASLEKVTNLLTLNTDPTRLEVNVISSVCECGIWSFIVGVYNNDQLTVAMVKQFKINLAESCIKYKETPVIGVYNFATPFTQRTLATYFTFLSCNCIKLISYVQVGSSPSCAATDTLLILHTNNICKTYRLLKSTDLTNPASLCTYNPENPTQNPVGDVPLADVNQVVTNAFANFLTGLTTFINKDQPDDAVVAAAAAVNVKVNTPSAVKTGTSAAKSKVSSKKNNKK